MMIETILTSGLLLNTRWMIDGTPLNFDFSLSHVELRKLPDDVLRGGDPAWCELLVFGEQGFAMGGGARPWLCVKRRDGSVYGFDPEREKPMFLLNSSVERFVATFQLFDSFLSRNKSLPPDCEDQFMAIDPEGYPDSDWRQFVECLRGTEP